ncbi:MAG TPA: serine hydrolase [Steroidobacteraceae bacterium]|nr:serine hydrolase [Steroidobacteraceae bacterium]
MRTYIALLAACLPALALAAPPKNFDARVESVMKASEVPGATVAIVENGKVTLARGYGKRALGSAEAVDTATLFQIGSTTKAFTAAALAILVEEGKIGWDDRVIDHLPDFRMYDPWVTREITVRDLLVHRSGLGRGQGDLLFVPSNEISRADMVRRIRFMKPATSFRSGFAYDNILYAVAGQVIEAVSGKTWEDFVEERILGPAGMKHAVTNDVDRLSRANRAHPHGRVGELRGVGDQQLFDEKRVALGANVGPAGAIAAGAEDLARWLQLQLASGQVPDSGERIFSADNAREMWQAVVPVPVTPLPPAFEDARPQFRGYALGWIVQDYRGHKIVQHAGGTQGFRAVVVLIPGKNVGFAIANNSEDNEFVPGLQYELLDHYLGLPKHDWPKAFKDLFEARNAAGLEAQRKAVADRPTSSPSLPLAGYAGDYADPWYGPIRIAESEGTLSIDFRQTPGMVAPLEHWAYDTFVARWPDPLIEPAFVTFALDASGKPARITMKAYSPVADFSFDYHDLEITPVPGKAAAGN